MDALSPVAEASFRADAVLHEVADALRELALDPRSERVIDLRSLPLDDGERARLRERLGAGEVYAAVDAAGRTSVDETGYTGVWWVRHANSDGAALFEQIVVARVPALLLAHPADVAAAAARLGAEVEAGTGVDHD